jgi:hypothetical protein
MMLKRAEVNQKNSEYGNPVGIGSRLCETLRRGCVQDYTRP